jgi:CheY-like chemotaxis protein
MEEQEKPQILVTDLNMPNMSGYELLAWVRDRRENFRLFVVVTTGVFDPEIEKKCRELGADELLPKGTPNDSIQALLRRLTEQAEREFGVDRK